MEIAGAIQYGMRIHAVTGCLFQLGKCHVLVLPHSCMYDQGRMGMIGRRVTDTGQKMLHHGTTRAWANTRETP